MMDWYGNGMGGGGSLIWVFMVMFWVALIALVVFLVVKLLPGSGSTRQAESPAAPTASAVETPEQVLDRMFAMGEIDEQTYRGRRAALTEMRKPS